MHRFAGRTIAAVATGAAVLLLAGCAAGSNDAGGASDPAQAGQPGAGAAERDAFAGAEDDAGSETGTGKPADQQQRVQVRSRAIIYTAEITVEVDDVPAAVRQAESVVTGADGLIANEASHAVDVGTENGAPTRTIASATLVVRVPPVAYNRVLTSLGDLGTVLQQNRSAQDVTEEVVDVASRIKSQQASVARIRALMEDARSLADVVLLESELTRRQAELESLLARQATLAEQTDLATITVHFTVEDTTAEEDDPELGFLSGLRSGWKAFAGAVAVALTVIGALIPFAVLAAVIGIPLLIFLRRARRVRPAPIPAARPEQAE